MAEVELPGAVSFLVLAGRCTQRGVERGVIGRQRGDHPAVVEELDMPRRKAGQTWAPNRFMQEVEARCDQDGAAVAGRAEVAPFDALVHEPVTGDVDPLQVRRVTLAW